MNVRIDPFSEEAKERRRRAILRMVGEKRPVPESSKSHDQVRKGSMLRKEFNIQHKPELIMESSFEGDPEAELGIYVPKVDRYFSRYKRIDFGNFLEILDSAKNEGCRYQCYKGEDGNPLMFERRGGEERKIPEILHEKERKNFIYYPDKNRDIIIPAGMMAMEDLEYVSTFKIIVPEVFEKHFEMQYSRRIMIENMEKTLKGFAFCYEMIILWRNEQKTTILMIEEMLNRVKLLYLLY